MVAMTPKKPQPPDAGDKRWKIVDATMRRYGFADHALIETLHTVQDCFGYLDEPGLRYVSASLAVPVSKVYGVATFYNHFTLKPKGAHTCVVCLGTACYIRGANQLLAALADELKVKPGETTPDGKVSVLGARCIGSCGLAPAAVFDGEVAGKVEPSEMVRRVREWVTP